MKAWTKMEDRKPEIGQLVLMELADGTSPLTLVRFPARVELPEGTAMVNAGMWLAAPTADDDGWQACGSLEDVPEGVTVFTLSGDGTVSTNHVEDGEWFWEPDTMADITAWMQIPAK